MTRLHIGAPHKSWRAGFVCADVLCKSAATMKLTLMFSITDPYRVWIIYGKT